MREFLNLVQESTEMWNGKNVVAQIGEYRIAVDDPADARYVSVWDENGKNVGVLSTRTTPDAVGRDYLSISRVETNAKHRGNGLGLAMYRALLSHLGAKWKGIGSYLPDQANKRQVPAIWRRLGGREMDDHVVVDRKAAPVIEEAPVEDKPFEWKKSPAGSRDVVVMIDVAKVDASAAKDKNFYVGPQGANGIKGRYERFDNWMKGGDVIEMPEVCLTDEGRISFINGRHRFAWMRDHGVETMPVSVPADDAEMVKAAYGSSLNEDRLDELSLPPTRNDADEVLTRSGYHKLGSGKFGSVYQKPGTPYVLKVFDAKDRAFLAFVTLTQTFNSEHFPKFIGKPLKITDEYYAIRTEELTPVEGHDNDATMIHGYITNVRDYGYPREDYAEYMKSRPSLKEACNILAKFLKTHDGQFHSDVWTQNLMMRGSTLVLNDPVAVYDHLL